MEDTGRDKLRTMLGELLDHMEGAEEVASGMVQRYPEYKAMSEAVRGTAEIVSTVCELEAYDERERSD